MSKGRRSTFACRLDPDQPPPLRGEVVNGRRTPTYVLAWVCSARKFFANLGDGERGKVNDRNFTDIVSKKWSAYPDLPYSLQPTPYLGGDGNYYLIIVFNTADAEHTTRVLNVDTDPLIQAAKNSMGVDKDEEVEKTLAWFRFPLSWVEAEERQREAARLNTQESDLDQMPASDGVKTELRKVSVH